MEALGAGQSFADIAYYLPYLHEPASILGYLPEGGYIVLGEEDAPRAVAETLAEQGEEARDRLERDGENPHGLAPAFLPWACAGAALAARPQARFAACSRTSSAARTGWAARWRPT